MRHIYNTQLEMRCIDIFGGVCKSPEQHVTYWLWFQWTPCGLNRWRKKGEEENEQKKATEQSKCRQHLEFSAEIWMKVFREILVKTTEHTQLLNNDTEIEWPLQCARSGNQLFCHFASICVPLSRWMNFIFWTFVIHAHLTWTFFLSCVCVSVFISIYFSFSL